MGKRGMSSGRLAGKTAFITAAGQGIGRAIALSYATEGAQVIATDVREELVAALGNGRIRTARLDVLHAEDIARASTDAGPVDILVNCAGFVHQGTILDATEADWDLAFELNVRSQFRTIRAFLPDMLEKGGGSIINIASAAGSVKAAPDRCVYSTTKAAVVGLTKSVAADYVTRGIRCNCICPGTIQTPSLDQRIAANAAQAGSLEAARAAFVARQAMGRLGEAEEIAGLAVYLGSDESAFMTGQAVVIDGGWSL
jgi:2-keto-3-deoxy-L-fuconate dehydrogenase